MTASTDADRLVAAWLASDGPTDLRPEVVDRALATARARRPRHGLSAALHGARPWPRTGQSPHLELSPVLALAALVLALTIAAVALVVGGHGPAIDLGPGMPIPGALQGHWVGEPRSSAGQGTSTRTALDLSADRFAMTGSPYPPLGIFGSGATITRDGDLRLDATTTGGCGPRDIGTYRRTLSAGDTILSISLVRDPCATRAAVVPGTWYHVTCKDQADGCIGTLGAGTYPSQYISPRLSEGDTWQPDFGAVRYTVPAGWANTADWPNILVLTPTFEAALDGPSGPPDGQSDEVDVYAQPFAARQDGSCGGEPDPGVERTVDGLLTWLRGLPSLSVSAATPVTIDGHPGTTVDLTLALSWTDACPGGSVPAAAVLAQGPQMDPDHGWGVVIRGGERVRLTLLDLGDGDVLALLIDGRDPSRFDRLAAGAQPILESLHFR